jgi:hypothetical protein
VSPYGPVCRPPATAVFVLLVMTRSSRSEATLRPLIHRFARHGAKVLSAGRCHKTAFRHMVVHGANRSREVVMDRIDSIGVTPALEGKAD